MFDLKQPCKDCPFISGGHMEQSLAAGRMDGIKESLRRDESFPCHKTVEYENGSRRQHKEQHCAGAMIYLYKNDRPNQAMRIGERLGMLKENELKGWELVDE